MMKRKIISLNLALLMLVSLLPFNHAVAAVSHTYEYYIIINGVEYDATKSQTGSGWEYRYYNGSDMHYLYLTDYSGREIGTNVGLRIFCKGINTVTARKECGIHSDAGVQIDFSWGNGERAQTFLNVAGAQGYAAIDADEVYIRGIDLTATGGGVPAISARAISFENSVNDPNAVLAGESAASAVPVECYTNQQYLYYDGVYTMVLDANGGTTSNGEKSKTLYNAEATPGMLYLHKWQNVFSNGSKKFLGWSDTPDENGKYYTTIAECYFDSRAEKLYALWEDSARKGITLKEYTGRMYGSCIYHYDETVTKMVYAGERFVFPEQERSGCSFDGWKSESDGSVHPAGSSILVTKSDSFVPSFSPLAITKMMSIGGQTFDASVRQQGPGFSYSPHSDTATLSIWSGTCTPIYIPCDVQIWIRTSSLYGRNGEPAITIDGDAMICRNIDARFVRSI